MDYENTIGRKSQLKQPLVQFPDRIRNLVTSQLNTQSIAPATSDQNILFRRSSADANRKQESIKKCDKPVLKVERIT